MSNHGKGAPAPDAANGDELSTRCRGSGLSSKASLHATQQQRNRQLSNGKQLQQQSCKLKRLTPAVS